MKKKIMVFTAIGLLVCTVAQARKHSLNTDGWNGVPMPGTTNYTWTGTSYATTSLLPDGTSQLLAGLTNLSFAPGSVGPTFSVGDAEDQIAPGVFTNRFEFVWNSEEQVIYTPTSSSSFTLDFNYADNSGCAGETASFQVNSLVFSTGSPCTKGTDIHGLTTDGHVPFDELNSHFLFDISSDGNIQLVGSSPWANTTAAPEIDLNSIAAGLPLLVGAIVVLRGRRRKI